ncbi:hypothetical protein JTB14_019058 [Gonioctena quinquepunctata]|nr:hypothetical protein JTB14_019058 [Gonioctena quinquepunctata]
MRKEWKRNLKKRQTTTNEQKPIILDFLDKHHVIVTGKCYPSVPREFECKWDELVDLLNAVENGSRKDKQQWKNFLNEWKCKTKKKARSLKDSLKTKTGGGGFSSSELSDLDNQLLSISGWISIVGSTRRNRPRHSNFI